MLKTLHHWHEHAAHIGMDLEAKAFFSPHVVLELAFIEDLHDMPI